MRYGTLFSRMRSVASTGGVAATIWSGCTSLFVRDRAACRFHRMGVCGPGEYERPGRVRQVRWPFKGAGIAHGGAGLSYRARRSAVATTAGIGKGIEVRGPAVERSAEVLTAEALDFVADLARTFEPTRRELLAERVTRQAKLKAGDDLRFLPETASVRMSAWRAAPVPAALEGRKVEITGPTDRKMVINALTSGASTYMAAFAAP